MRRFGIIINGMSETDVSVACPDAASSEDERQSSETGKSRYHHGDLRCALIAAGRGLAEAHGPDGVTFAAASRQVGVSATAPYRHFKDRAEFLDEVAAAIFSEVAESLRAVEAESPKGSVEALIALGKTYVRFHAEHPRLFGLMWNDREHRGDDSAAAKAGRRCFAVLLDAVEAWKARNPVAIAPAETIAAPMWLAVHGLASLGGTRAFAATAPGMTPDQMIELTVPRILEGVKTRGARGEI